MNAICPVCNGLNDEPMVCGNCGILMNQAGRLEDYKGPYSPYMGKDTFAFNNDVSIIGDNCCIHLYTCPDCNRLEHKSVQLLIM
ncbi:MAG: hypothetical protein ACOYEH_05440 [Caldicoprobacterales bacterium]|nr:hypothetical protein [Clostridiales bacterium]